MITWSGLVRQPVWSDDPARWFIAQQSRQFRVAHNRKLNQEKAAT
ncbi:hypothetical protein ACPOL_5443 [Acidisarcina polymorpha]|uniref:Uncharacterized protein n=1 Tax=Acidisarcina polymorpha TaxID=2211140 RepID=A0A2Z5G6G3_9BACT|nr:hypothetical protein ACPOL_5443 [Acidisarcina polymorpha]